MKIVTLSAGPEGPALEEGIFHQLIEIYGVAVYSVEIVQDQEERWSWMESEVAGYLEENPNYFREHVNEDDPLEDIYEDDGSFYSIGENLTVVSNAWWDKSKRTCGVFIFRMSQAGLLLAQQLVCDIELYAADGMNWESDERAAWARCAVYAQESGRLRRVRSNGVDP